eukprot:361576_1
MNEQLTIVSHDEHYKRLLCPGELRVIHNRSCKILNCVCLQRIADVLRLYEYIKAGKEYETDKILKFSLQQFSMINEQQDALNFSLDEYEFKIKRQEYITASALHSALDAFEGKIREPQYIDPLHSALDEFETMEHRKQVTESSQKQIKSIRDLFSEIANCYTNVSLLNDYNHLLFYHANEFEDIFNALTKNVQCNGICHDQLSQCISMRRNQRNRAQITKNEK